MSNKYIMIKTPDERKFFTHAQNFPQIENFAKIFKAEVSIVEMKDAEVLDLEELAPAICNGDYETKDQSYNIIEIKLPKGKKNRKQILSNSKKINTYIREKLEKGRSLSLKNLKKKFEPLNVTSACLCTHFKRTREDMKREGFKFEKIAGGTYKKATVK